ncbi:hypothetical protein K438DRAFT_1747512 [Mycena galopus ATCC 62051]|nr:hypothetical protein K438DRAFT_1747512 [Mycena galopus ATCC 62051]
MPHFTAIAARISAAHPEAILLCRRPYLAAPDSRRRRAPRRRCARPCTLITRHWNRFNADALGLLRGKYSSTLQAVKIGSTAIRKSLQEQLGLPKGDTLTLGAFPTIIGEIETPFDMDSKRAYCGDSRGRGVGDYSAQEKALDANLNAADGPNALSYAVWTYCLDSTHAYKGSPGGSTINLEVVPPDMTASTSGATQVGLAHLLIDEKTTTLLIDGKDLVDVGVDVQVSGGRWRVEGQVLRWWYDVPAAGEPEREYTIEIRRAGAGSFVSGRRRPQ